MTIVVPKTEANIFNTHLCKKIVAVVVPKIVASAFNCFNFGYNYLICIYILGTEYSYFIFVPKIEANIFNTHLCEKILAISCTQI